MNTEITSHEQIYDHSIPFSSRALQSVQPTGLASIGAPKQFGSKGKGQIEKSTSATNASSSSNPHIISSLITPFHSFCSFLTFFNTLSPDLSVFLFWVPLPFDAVVDRFSLVGGSSGDGNF